MGLGFRSSLAGCFWLRVSHEVAVKMSVRATVIWRLKWGSQIYFQDGWLTHYQE